MSQPNPWNSEEEDLPDVDNASHNPTESASSDTQPLFVLFAFCLGFITPFFRVVSQATEEPTETTTQQLQTPSQLPPVLLSIFCLDDLLF